MSKIFKPQVSYRSFSSPKLVAKRLELLRLFTTSKLLCRPDAAMIARQLALAENEMRHRKIDFRDDSLSLKQPPNQESPL